MLVKTRSWAPEGFAATLEARPHGLRDIMASEVKSGGINLASFIEIEDEKRRLIETVSFTDAVSLSTSVTALIAGRFAKACSDRSVTFPPIAVIKQFPWNGRRGRIQAVSAAD